MATSEKIILVARSDTRDSLGITRQVVREKAILCRAEHVSGSEFARAGQVGIRARYRFTVDPAEYAGETEIRFGGETYGVYRVYQPGTGRLELYTEVKAGV
jgi:hypothetical protein